MYTICSGAGAVTYSPSRSTYGSNLKNDFPRRGPANDLNEKIIRNRGGGGGGEVVEEEETKKERERRESAERVAEKMRGYPPPATGGFC